MPSEAAILSRSACALLLVTLCLAVGCNCERRDDPDRSPEETTQQKVKAEAPPLGPPEEKPTPRVGMVYIPPGALVVGTPRDQRPRRADRELPGEQIMLDGFYIDKFAFPNEEGAIPVTNVTQQEAEALCEESGKRLCTEIEWERACKGPDNRTYEYGQTYDESACRTGTQAQLRPSGFVVGCQSDYGVRDLHGGPFEWTSSSYGRGSDEDSVALRGGNGKPGEVLGRCANVEPRDPGAKSGTVGFRCCHGPKNESEVELEIEHGPGLIPRARFDDELEKSLLAALPTEAREKLESKGEIERHRVWLWRPVANEELHLMALCGRGDPTSTGPHCGLFVAQVAPGKIQALAWVSSGRWVADLHRPGPHELLWLVGGDRRGSFKRLLKYAYGDIEVGAQSRGGPKKSKR